MPRAAKLKPGVWRKCPLCDDYLCTLHKMHAYECSCPSIEEWAEQGIDPYYWEEEDKL
jgi:hypothetical protein